MPAQTFILRSSCPLCGSVLPARGERFVIQQFDERVRMVECPTCGLVYKAQRPTQAFLEGIYGGNYGHLAKLPTLGDPSMIEHVRRMGDLTGRSHLDYGCGSGALVLHARDMGVESFGADPFLTEAALQAHPRWLSRKNARAVAEETPERYDAISLWSVIEHLEHPLEDIRHLALGLKPAGRLFFDAPNADSLIARKCGANWGSALLIEHLTFWTPKAIHFLAEQTGCEVLQVKRSGIPYPLGKRPADARSFGVPTVGRVPAVPVSAGDQAPVAGQTSQRLLAICRKLKAQPLMGSIARVMLDVSGIGDQFRVVLGKRVATTEWSQPRG